MWIPFGNEEVYPNGKDEFCFWWPNSLPECGRPVVDALCFAGLICSSRLLIDWKNLKEMVSNDYHGLGSRCFPSKDKRVKGIYAIHFDSWVRTPWWQGQGIGTPIHSLWHVPSAIFMEEDHGRMGKAKAEGLHQKADAVWTCNWTQNPNQFCSKVSSSNMSLDFLELATSGMPSTIGRETNLLTEPKKGAKLLMHRVGACHCCWPTFSKAECRYIL